VKVTDADSYIPLSEAVMLLPRPVNRETIARWSSRGVRRPGGGRARLETIRLGGRLLTTAGAVRRFPAELAPEPTHAA
jgi:hypothetical protein